jgi:hypothetical protein
MPRRLRIEYEGAIYQVMARGNARRDIVRDDYDRRRLLNDLERAVVRSGWELPAFAVLSNHLPMKLSVGCRPARGTPGEKPKTKADRVIRERTPVPPN